MKYKHLKLTDKLFDQIVEEKEKTLHNANSIIIMALTEYFERKEAVVADEEANTGKR